MEELLKKAKKNSYIIARLSDDTKNEMLSCISDALKNSIDQIIRANSIDIENAKARPAHFQDRLKLDEKRIIAMADGLYELVKLPDPIGRVLDDFTTADNLRIKKVSVPFGVVAIIYEARPNVTIDCIGLCLKSGNSIVLRGSSEAINSNKCLVEISKEALKENGYPYEFIQLIEDTTREGAKNLMLQNKYVDVLIPRGSAGLIRSCVENSRIPIIETGTGNCHIYVEKTADFEMAKNILINAKTQRISVCNAAESLLVDSAIAKDFLTYIAQDLEKYNVQVVGCAKTIEILKNATLASDEDYFSEFLDYKISIKIVNDYKEATEHINKYGTKHSDAIITNDQLAQDYFMQNVDSACVYANASTRFTDGFMFGFGAEMGISTQKLHARGPMGLKQLCSYKYQIQGEGQTRK